MAHPFTTLLSVGQRRLLLVMAPLGLVALSNWLAFLLPPYCLAVVLAVQETGSDSDGVQPENYLPSSAAFVTVASSSPTASPRQV